MGPRFEFRLMDRLRFYLMYAVRKVFFIWAEVKRPRFRMFLYELMYSARKLAGPDHLMPSPFEDNYVETRFGRFRIRPRTLDMSNVSPAYERDDLDFLLRLIDDLARQNKRVLFLDIGADLGTFTVSAGNRFGDSMRIVAFEPVPSSFALLEENIRLNGLKDVAQAHNVALWKEDRDGMDFYFNPLTPGSSGFDIGGTRKLTVTARKLDTVLGQKACAFDALVLKMDVEGAESDVLRGAVETLASAHEIYLMVEDFINPAIIGYLEGIGARFICKLTPYNSWWRLEHEPE